MKTTKWLLSVAAGLVLACLAWITPAEASAPVSQTFEINDTHFDEFASAICGVPLEHTVIGTVSELLFFDDGELERVIQNVRVVESWTNLETGASVSTTPIGAVVHVDIGGADDGRNVVRVTGLQGHLIVPGVGSVAQDSGQLVPWGQPGTIPTIIKEVGLFNGMGGPFPTGCEFVR